MNEFTKIYVPILGVVLAFSGFWYVKSYFGFFSMNEVLPTLGFDYIAQFSFSIFFELITFSDLWRSSQFVFLVLFLVVLAYVLPNFYLNSKFANEVLGVSGVPLAPFWLRVLFAASISFCWIFLSAHQIGKVHACHFMQGKTGLVSTLDSVFSKEDYGTFYGAFGINPETAASDSDPIPRLVEVWRNSNFVYVLKAENDCQAQRTLLKIPTDRFPMIRVTMQKVKK